MTPAEPPVVDAPGKSIKRRLVWSHLVAITASTFVYAAGGFVLMVMILVSVGGYTPRTLVELVPQFAGLTGFVVVQIFLITLCGLIVARIAGAVVSRGMLRQIAALESGSIDVARGNLQRRVDVISDDELGSLARRFNYLAEQLDIAERHRQAFVANVSHDLRTPIAIIRGHLDAQLGDRDETGIPVAASLKAIDNEIQTLSRLVDELFTHSRLEDGVVPVTSIPVDLGQLIDRAVQGIRAYALTHARVSVHAQVPEGLPQVLADPTKTTQVINNLLHNAVRHTPAGGLVVVQLEPSNGSLRAIVRDTGVGIPPEKVGHVFDRYYQADRREGTYGSGLGLSIVKRLVELQSGRVGIESEVDAGTSVWFELPVANLESAQPRPRITGRLRVP